MKKIIFLGLLISIFNNGFSQSITKLGFNKINNDIRSIIFSIDSEEDFDLNAETDMSLSDVADEEEEFDFSEEMLSLADSEGIDLLDDEFDFADFDFMDDKEKDSVS